MRLVRLISSVSIALIASLSLVACGGDDPLPVLLDAAPPPDSMPIPDAEPCPSGDCDGVCVNFDTSEQTCGNCTTVCNGGEACNGGVCACVAPYVPASPTFVFSQLIDAIPGAKTGFGVYPFGGLLHVLGVGYPVGDTAVEVGREYELMPPPDEGIPSPPFVATGYNVENPQSPEFDAAHYATAGTIVFNRVCAEGFSGTATDVVFSPVAGLTDPTIDDDGCEPFTVASLTFSYGMACPTPQQ